MSKQKRKLLATVTPEKPRQEKSFVQVEGELTEAQLEAIAGGLLPPTGNHNETMVSAAPLNLEGGTDGAHKNGNYLPHQIKLPQKSPWKKLKALSAALTALYLREQLWNCALVEIEQLNNLLDFGQDRNLFARDNGSRHPCF